MVVPRTAISELCQFQAAKRIGEFHCTNIEVTVGEEASNTGHKCQKLEAGNGVM